MLVCLGFMAFEARSRPGLEQLTMAHNQDRLQNSDSSVVYGHGHIIYSHTANVGDTPLRQAIKQPTMSLNGPPQKHISVYLSKECALLHNIHQSSALFLG